MEGRAKAVFSVAVLFLVVALTSYTQGYLDSSSFATSPHISLTEVDTKINEKVNIIVEGPDPINSLICESNIHVGFNLVNSGDIDGFVTVSLIVRGSELYRNRYFIRAKTEDRKYMGGVSTECGLTEKSVSVQIIELERP